MKILFYQLSGIVALLVNVGMALLVFLHERKNSANVRFVWLSLCIGLWAVGSWMVNIIPNKQVALWVLKCNYAFGVFVPVIFLDFVAKLSGLNKAFFLKVGYLVSTLLLVGLLTPYFISGLRLIPQYNFYISKPGIIYWGFFVYFCFYFLFAFIVIFSALRNVSFEKSRQLKYIFLAYFIGMIAGLEYFCSVFEILKRPPIDDYILIFTFIILTYAIMKHTLLDIHIVITRTIFYSILASAISVLYALAIFLLNAFFSNETLSIRNITSSTTPIFIITLFLMPFEVFLRSLLDQKFFKGTLSQISKQKEKLEVELERRERLKSVGILAAGMAHEIRNPLTVINTFTDYLPEKYEDPQFREKFQKIVKAEILRMKNIVTDLLLFSRPADPVPRKSDIQKILSDILTLLSSDMVKNNVQVKTFFHSNEEAFVDPDQIKQAFLNIILNAMDAMKEKENRELLIQTEVLEGGFLEIQIKDTGCGIAKEKLNHIFDPFYTDKEQGTGLGLAITYSIIEKNRGAITVQSKLGEGATFSIKLPLS